MYRTLPLLSQRNINSSKQIEFPPYGRVLKPLSLNGLPPQLGSHSTADPIKFTLSKQSTIVDQKRQYYHMLQSDLLGKHQLQGCDGLDYSMPLVSTYHQQMLPHATTSPQKENFIQSIVSYLPVIMKNPSTVSNLNFKSFTERRLVPVLIEPVQKSPYTIGLADDDKASIRSLFINEDLPVRSMEGQASYRCQPSPEMSSISLYSQEQNLTPERTVVPQNEFSDSIMKEFIAFKRKQSRRMAKRAIPDRGFTRIQQIVKRSHRTKTIYVCNKQNRHLQLMKNHALTHPDLLGFKCPKCLAIFQRKSDLRRHLMARCKDLWEYQDDQKGSRRRHLPR